MTEYEKQAADFLEKTGATLEARYLKYAPYFPEDEDSRDIWEIKLKRGSREYVFTFGSSLHDLEEWQDEIWKKRPSFMSRQTVEQERQKLIIARKVNQWGEMGKDHRPTAYDILAGMSKYEPADNVDDFAAEFGYTKPSQALKIFNAVQEEYKNLKMLFSDEEMELLREVA